MSTPTTDERLARLEARVADLERRLTGAKPEGPLSRRIRRTLPDPDVEAFYRRIGAVGPTIGAQALRQMQIDEGADPTSTAASDEIIRMRGE